MTVRGRTRSVGWTVTWAALTLGVYAIIYYAIAFREVNHQNGRRHAGTFFLGFIPVVGLVFILLYLVRELRLLHSDRSGLGLELGPSVQSVVLWATVGVLILVGPLVALTKVMRAVNGYWVEVEARFAA